MAAGIAGAPAAAAPDAGTSGAGTGVGVTGTAASVGAGTDAEGGMDVAVGLVSRPVASDFIASEGATEGDGPDGGGAL